MKLIHFTAEWCQPCKMMKPIIDEIISERSDLEYESIDIDKNQEATMQYSVMSVPTFILEKEDGTFSKVSGAMKKSTFLEKLGI